MMVAGSVYSQYSYLLQAGQLGIKSWCEWDLLYWPDWPQGAPNPLYSEYWVFSEGKVASSWFYHPPTSICEVVNELEL